MSTPSKPQKNQADFDRILAATTTELDALAQEALSDAEVKAKLEDSAGASDEW